MDKPFPLQGQLDTVRVSALNNIDAFFERKPDFALELTERQQFMLEGSEDTLTGLDADGVVYELEDGEVMHADYEDLVTSDIVRIHDTLLLPNWE
jgi:hypothetical protein